MIVKLQPNAAQFGPTVAYLLKPRIVMPEVLGGTVLGKTATDLTEQFNVVASERPDIAKPVKHVIIAWRPGEKVTSEQMLAVAERYLGAIGVDETKHQWVLVHHGDTEHDHMHLVLNRVGLDGSVYNQRRGDLLAGERLRKELETEYGWTPAQRPQSEQRYREDLSEIHLADREGLRSAKHRVHMAVRQAIESSDGTFMSFAQQLQEGGQVAPLWSENESGFNGASFALLSAIRPGEPEVSAAGRPFVFKGSQVRWSRDQIEERLARRRAALLPRPAPAGWEAHWREKSREGRTFARRSIAPSRLAGVLRGRGKRKVAWQPVFRSCRSFDARFSRRIEAVFGLGAPGISPPRRRGPERS